MQNVVDVALVGGADELSPIQYHCYDDLGALNEIKVGDDELIVPKRGGGLILGEGAGVLVMERLDFALERGAEIYGRLRSGVITGGTAPIGHYEAEGRQMGRAMSLAMEAAGLDADEIDQIHVSANFSRELDCMEYHQLQRIVQKDGRELRVTPLKYLTGDFGGAGALRAVAILLSLHNELPVPTVKAEILSGGSEDTLKWEFDQKEKPRTALMTTSTFGGGSASLIFTKD